jgi:hypothetical protein
MEKRLNKKIELYISAYKADVKSKIVALDFEDNAKVVDLLDYVFDHSRLVLDKDDFMKRKRVKNSIPELNRCVAKISNGEQCTRRRKSSCEFCGTHSKGIPHGSMNADSVNDSTSIQTTNVFAEDIKGIVYYIDQSLNVFKTEDILQNKENPLIIAKAVKTGNIYSIPSIGL